MITIIDYGMGNLGSISNMLKKVGYTSEITRDANRIRLASKLILPGVGSFDKAMININDFGLRDVIFESVSKKTPILGICLGMQIMMKGSEEGLEAGLALINGHVNKFNFTDQEKFKIPHMGWNVINPLKKSGLIKDMDEQARFYFVHSYYVVCSDEEDILATTNYGSDFVSAFARENIFGVQFHPEKSHKFGMKFLKNFVENF